ncbi:type II toxin-antitoxin system RelE/ParE family toxin [Phyllobacterium sp. LjRoot231]|uniref:type II toxin-antitoxin system RelE/ParE family toxin n=1 Tax=Phyllobacterium sp. LjRoot231 TaxID=3342289 RepID=UPI003F50D05D
MAGRFDFTARLSDAVYVLSAFQKKTQTTRAQEIKLARVRYKQLKRQLHGGDGNV